MTIYIPDDLAAMVKEHDDLNVSGVCQGALRAELARREAFAELGKGMKREVVNVQHVGGRRFDETREVAFVGKELAYTDKRPEMTAFLTKRHRIAIYDADAEALYEFDTFDDLTGDQVWRDSHPEFLAEIAEQLGEKHIIELDI